MKPLFSNYNEGSQNITLIDNENIVSNDKEIAKIFNQFLLSQSSH